jgi:membrane-associated phospholipid phosphatase
LQSRLTGASAAASLGVKTSLRIPRLILRGLRVIRPFLQFGLLALAGYICLTRISNYKHHSTDVLTGSILGAINGYLALHIIINLPQKPRIFHHHNHNGFLPTTIMELNQQVSRDSLEFDQTDKRTVL